MIKSILKGILVLSLTTICSIQADAQKKYTSSGRSSSGTGSDAGGFDKSRLVYGGGLYGGGGSNMISIGASPIIGYRLTDYLAAGVSLGYKYFYSKNYFPVYNFQWQRTDYYNLNNHIFVPGLWTRARIYQNFFAHAEFEYNISTYKYHDIDYQNNQQHISYRVTETVPCLLLGAGVRQPVSENAAFVIYALYDVLQNIPSNQIQLSNGQKISKSPYAGTIDIRMGLIVGF